MAMVIATFTGALILGIYLQFGDAGSGPLVAEGRVDYTDFTATSSASDAERAAVGLPPLRAASAEAPLNVPLRREATAPSGSCEVTLASSVQSGAMVDLLLSAPCNGGERFTLHHNGMMFSALTQPDGRWRGQVPALATPAVFVADFSGLAGAVTQADVGTLRFFDRVVLQWQGQNGLQLHALEYGAQYFGPGHVWTEARGSAQDAIQNGTGFLVRLGDDSLPGARIAEIYSFPAATSEKPGSVSLTVETEVLAATCGKDITAETLEVRGGGAVRTQDLSIAVPGCGSVGEYLVLQNMLQDMTIAAR